MPPVRRINELFADRARLIEQRQLEHLGVIINGQDQDDNMVSLVRPTLEAEIGRRILLVERDLRSLGAVLA